MPTLNAAGTHTINNGPTVNRLGYGAMQITGKGIWGEPDDVEGAKNVLRKAVELGVNFIDTADSYGPDVSERLIGEALHPYADDLLIATKAGMVRPGPGKWNPNGKPEHIKEACEGSLKRLKLETIPLYQLHRIDPKVPAEESMGAMLELQQAGKIKHIGVSEVSADDLKNVRGMATIVSVQNRYNIADREWDDVVDVCEKDGIAFIPWFPVGSGDLGKAGEILDDVAKAHDTSRYAVAIAWLLHRSKTMLPIPGTKSVEHLKDNLSAAELLGKITDDQWQRLDAAG